jgi:outer membrane protein assembly factor BamB
MKAIYLFALVTLLPIAALAAETEWPAYKGSSGLTGWSADDSIRPPFKLVWTYRLDGDFSSDGGAGVTVAGNRLFANVHNTRSILALDARTGRFIWEYSASAVGYMTVPAYANGQLFLLQRQHRLASIVVLDADSGKPLWQKPLELRESIPTVRDCPWSVAACSAAKGATNRR